MSRSLHQTHHDVGAGGGGDWRVRGQPHLDRAGRAVCRVLHRCDARPQQCPLLVLPPHDGCPRVNMRRVVFTSSYVFGNVLEYAVIPNGRQVSGLSSNTITVQASCVQIRRRGVSTLC